MPPKNLDNFRDQIDEALLLIPDSHLKARLDKHPSLKRIRGYKKSQVGKNNISDPKKIWETRYDLIGKKKILYISITEFPEAKDHAWVGFLESVKSMLKKSDSIVLDMRGNGGGSDTIGMRLAEILFGHAFEYPVVRQYRSQTPETMALNVNRYKLKVLYLKESQAQIPDYYSTMIKEERDDYALAVQGKLPAEYIRTNKGTGKRTDPVTGYKKPIYILMDAECSSSCETTIDAFEWHKYVKRVGENTDGCIHFDNIGYILLPNSRIEVMIPTQYNEYFDKRFIEKIGIAPDIRVASGDDAYEAVKRLIEK
ncbi:MAG: hypothetical protein H7256_15640 [Bdellovibrio sp.]|nr:hypothetical protein [Bdellovibrio sp.]